VAKTQFKQVFFVWKKIPPKAHQSLMIENTNGRLRRALARSTNLKELSEDIFDEIIDNYNHTPRK
jgi:IS30 family transposase